METGGMSMLSQSRPAGRLSRAPDACEAITLLENPHSNLDNRLRNPIRQDDSRSDQNADGRLRHPAPCRSGAHAAQIEPAAVHEGVRAATLAPEARRRNGASCSSCSTVATDQQVCSSVLRTNRHK